MLLNSYFKPHVNWNFHRGLRPQTREPFGRGLGGILPPRIYFGFGVKILLVFRVFQYYQVVQSEFYSNYGGIYSTA